MSRRQVHAHPNPTLTLTLIPTVTPAVTPIVTPTVTLALARTAGKYTPLYRQTACTICPEASYCALGAASPTACAPGTVGDRTGLAGASECTPCFRGFWCSAGQAIACPGDTFNDVQGRTNQGA